MTENKIDEYLKNIKGNLSWQEMDELHQKMGVELSDIKYNIKKLELNQVSEETAEDNQIIADGMREMGYPYEEVKKFLND